MVSCKFSLKPIHWKYHILISWPGYHSHPRPRHVSNIFWQRPECFNQHRSLKTPTLHGCELCPISIMNSIMKFMKGWYWVLHAVTIHDPTKFARSSRRDAPYAGATWRFHNLQQLKQRSEFNWGNLRISQNQFPFTKYKPTECDFAKMTSKWRI